MEGKLSPGSQSPSQAELLNWLVNSATEFRVCPGRAQRLESLTAPFGESHWCREQDLNLSRLAGVSAAGACWRNPERSRGTSETWCREQDLNLSRLAGVSAAGACWRNPERSRGTSETWCREQDLNLSRLAGVSAAGACWRNPERSRGTSETWCREQDLNLHALRHTVLSRARLPIPPSRQDAASL